MNLRGITFRPVLDASGARNFDGRGWWYHSWLKPFGLDFSHSTFVAKTTTLHPRPGNMILGADGLTPAEKFPDCVVVRFWKGAALNAVGLSGPGAKFLLDKGFWQAWPEAFFLSFMAVGSTHSERLKEIEGFVDLLQRYKKDFASSFGLQINFSCPNVSHQKYENFIEEVSEILAVANDLDIPLMPKLSVTTPVEVACEIARLKICDALCVSNTIPWGSFREHISWETIFGSRTSPLEKYGGGGLSGAPLFPLVLEWVSRAIKVHKISKPINAGGGILSSGDVRALKSEGVHSFFLGSAAFLRPWRVRGIIREAGLN